jgi:pyruvate dehydrogenase E1 component alpha subunit
MHIADIDSGNLGANAIVGGSAGIATGAAMSAKRRGSGQIAVCFFGEGALGQGLLYEVMNMASLWNLPVLYVCENNLYNEYTHHSETTSGSLLARAKAFDIYTEEIDGQDVRLVYTTAMRLIKRIREESKPGFLLCNTYRFLGHHVGDINREYYRSKEEENEWKTNRDPLTLLARWMLEEKIATQDILDQIDREVTDEASTAVEFAKNAPYPDVSEVTLHVYA